jgi:hypothetical protein
MDYLHSFFTYKRSDLHQTYFNRLSTDCQECLSRLQRKDQEKLLDTLSKQSEDRIQLLLSILGQLKTEVIHELFKKEVRLLNALLKADTSYLEEYSKKPDQIESAIMKERNERM